MKIPHLRWIIAALLCAATLLNYLDRQALGIVSLDIRREFHLSEQDYAAVLSFFFFAYAIMYAGSGWIVDRLGTRRGFAVFILGWSGAQMLHGLATGRTSLSVYRFLLGLTEPGAWPAAAKAVNEWFPAEQRALVMGIFNAGSSLGSMLAPIVVGALTIEYGWRAAFVITGVGGLAWTALWLMLYSSPRSSGSALISAHRRPLMETVRTRPCWTLMLTRFFTDPVIYFVIFWLPEYLRKERGFDLAMVRNYSWVPFVWGGVGYVLGGWMSGRLMRAGWALPRARKFVMALGAACLPVAILAPLVPTAALAILCTCFITFGHGLWVANLQTIPTDIYRGAEIGTVTGFSGSGGAVGGLLAQLGTGWLVTHFSYTPIFLLAGLMHPVSAVLTYALLPDREFQRGAKPGVGIGSSRRGSAAPPAST